MNEHEEGFLHFVLPPQKRRLQALFDLGAKRRGEIKSLLDHSIRLDPKNFVELSGGEQVSDIVALRLRALGAPENCYVLGGCLDGRVMRLGDTLRDVIGSGDGVFVSCVPGQLGYFEYEDASSGRILHRIPVHG